MAEYIEKIKVGTGNAWNIRDAEAHTKINNIWETIYPVGSIYMSVASTSPADLFGGVWERIQDRFLLAAGESYDAGATGGETTHTLTIDEIPTHAHNISASTTGTGSIDPEDEPFKYDGELTSYITTAKQTLQTGGGKAHNNMPPYLAVYVWCRIS